jgi:hypothetical protein
MKVGGEAMPPPGAENDCPRPKNRGYSLFLSAAAQPVPIARKSVRDSSPAFVGGAGAGVWGLTGVVFAVMGTVVAMVVTVVARVGAGPMRA